jgi:hypothetical protein
MEFHEIGCVHFEKKCEYIAPFAVKWSSDKKQLLSCTRFSTAITSITTLFENEKCKLRTFLDGGFDGIFDVPSVVKSRTLRNERSKLLDYGITSLSLLDSQLIEGDRSHPNDTTYVRCSVNQTAQRLRFVIPWMSNATLIQSKSAKFHIISRQWKSSEHSEQALQFNHPERRTTGVLRRSRPDEKLRVSHRMITCNPFGHPRVESCTHI